MSLVLNKIGSRKEDGLKLIVGMAKMEVSADLSAQLVTYALGSCLGIAVHDPIAGVGGLLHVMMPDSTIDAGRAEYNPSKFVDTGVPKLFRACYDLGARKERMVLKVAGGASNKGADNDFFQIGKRNFA
ncbi:MAG TPA: chemotaxis protein CheD, partial [Blastocatellia bacterium]|nr:chemotaxis protein CheD [Blastocatellia bacterium]